MALTEASISFLTQTLTTFLPADELLNVGEPYFNAADGTLWVGTERESPLEIGLNAKTGIVSQTGKYLTRKTSENNNSTIVNIPYNSNLLKINEYFEFFILFIADTLTFSGSYSQQINWGSIPDPLIDLDTGKTMLVKFFSYGNNNEWNAIPVWSDDQLINLFTGSASKFYYTEIESPSGLVMPQRKRLKFQSSTTATLTDDLTNDTTIVELGRKLVTKISNLTSFQLDYNLSNYYVFSNVGTVNLPSGSLPFEVKLINKGTSAIALPQGTYNSLLPNKLVAILFDGSNYHNTEQNLV